jgi:predicted MFS family arabinose efflux permease
MLWPALALTAILALAAFLVIPFIATYLARNAGVGERELALVYLAGGAMAAMTPGRLKSRMVAGCSPALFLPSTTRRSQEADL